ncbi:MULTISPECIES: TetR/AcrR family transcriptional regulator [Shinella]|jgi:AcrR family transcriptional regulator|uniref:TetR family transcriptional regulator n=1 Tax=Shinella granuli TaxID=323621 RepID=A0A4R2CKG9_SHIGR|nr:MULTISPECIES: TetR family transcriptional regulator [Shinella]ANH06309.1 TetR family transcriptional regulator [Shinella sp. HZN7]TCN41266.1 TetR family transcriptional regulator [Shinella granuli]
MARSNKERTEATRLALIEAARRLFVDRGYADTATPDIVAEAGVTRGALYHHFEDKKALFRATLEREAAAVAAHIDTVSLPAGSPREALLSGAAAYFDAMAVPGRTRLLLLEAPAVLGFEGAGAIDRDNAEGTLKAGLSDLIGKGVDAARLQALTDLISAAFDRAAIAIETGADRKAYEDAVASLLDGLVRA